MTIPFLKLLMLIVIISTSCSTPDAKQLPEKSSTEKFMYNMARFCGQTLSGEIFNDSEESGLNGQLIEFNFQNCSEDEIRINVMMSSPEKKTLVLTLLNNEILLKHDVRSEDLSPAALTMYGGFSCSDGNESTQVFPIHNFGQNIWPELEKYSWEICINEDEAILEYMELAGEAIIKHYILRFPGTH
jgi:hypothetical protein